MKTLQFFFLSIINIFISPIIIVLNKLLPIIICSVILFYKNVFFTNRIEDMLILFLSVVGGSIFIYLLSDIPENIKETLSRLRIDIIY